MYELYKERSFSLLAIRNVKFSRLFCVFRSIVCGYPQFCTQHRLKPFPNLVVKVSRLHRGMHPFLVFLSSEGSNVVPNPQGGSAAEALSQSLKTGVHRGRALLCGSMAYPPRQGRVRAR